MTALIMVVAAYGLITSDHVIRKFMCLVVLDSMVILEFLGSGSLPEGRAPILDAAASGPMVDPLPQAMMLTAIVIGVCFNALAAAFIIRLHRSGRPLYASQLYDD